MLLVIIGLNLWLKTDLMLPVKVYSKSYVVTWKLRNIWDNSMIKIRDFNILATHIYKKGNHCGDKLVNLVF